MIILIILLVISLLVNVILVRKGYKFAEQYKIKSTLASRRFDQCIDLTDALERTKADLKKANDEIDQLKLENKNLRDKNIEISLNAQKIRSDSNNENNA